LGGDGPGDARCDCDTELIRSAVRRRSACVPLRSELPDPVDQVKPSRTGAGDGQRRTQSSPGNTWSIAKTPLIALYYRRSHGETAPGPPSTSWIVRPSLSRGLRCARDGVLEATGLWFYRQAPAGCCPPLSQPRERFLGYDRAPARWLGDDSCAEPPVARCRRDGGDVVLSQPSW
jgi:hypothetical protein